MTALAYGFNGGGVLGRRSTWSRDEREWSSYALPHSPPPVPYCAWAGSFIFFEQRDFSRVEGNPCKPRLRTLTPQAPSPLECRIAAG